MYHVLFQILYIRFFSLIVFLTSGIIPTGPANISCIVSNFIYSFYTLNRKYESFWPFLLRRPGR